MQPWAGDWLGRDHSQFGWMLPGLISEALCMVAEWALALCSPIPVFKVPLCLSGCLADPPCLRARLSANPVDHDGISCEHVRFYCTGSMQRACVAFCYDKPIHTSKAVWFASLQA